MSPKEGGARVIFPTSDEETKDPRGRVLPKDTGMNKQQSLSGNLQPPEWPHIKPPLWAGATQVTPSTLML